MIKSIMFMEIVSNVFFAIAALSLLLIILVAWVLVLDWISQIFK